MCRKEIFSAQFSESPTTQELARVGKDCRIICRRAVRSVACSRRSKGGHVTLIARTSEARSSTGIVGSSPLVLTGRLRKVIHDRLPFLDLLDNVFSGARGHTALIHCSLRR
jgi:hypothetical protein